MREKLRFRLSIRESKSGLMSSSQSILRQGPGDRRERIVLNASLAFVKDCLCYSITSIDLH